MSSSLIDVCRFNPTAGGTTDWTYSSAVVGYQSPTAAKAVNGAQYSYRAESADLSQWEVGIGNYNSGTGVFARTTVLFNSAGTTAKISFTVAPQVAIVALAEDLGNGNNILINADFRINQRAYVSAATLAAGSYGHDRWKAGASGGNYSFTQLASSTQITIAASKTLIQVIEPVNVAGGSYVLSWSGTCQARVGLNSATPSGSFASSPIQISGQTAGTVMSVEFGNGAATGTLGTVKLETGSNATPFVMRDYDAEFDACLRYFEAWPIAAAAFAPVATGQATSTTAVQAFTFFKKTKRVAPSLTISNAGDFVVTTASGAVQAVTALSLGAADLGSAYLLVSVASGLVAGNAAGLYRNNTAASALSWNAEL